jgi:hypothetical protein
MKYFIIVLTCLVVGSCQEKKSANSQLFAKGKSLGQVVKRLEEASGLVESIAQPNHFWTLNDSGHPAEVFLIDTNAQIKLVCKLKGIENRDFEDIALAIDPRDGKRYVYAADIGDNLEKFKVKLIYRFEEPTLATGAEMTITKFDTIKVVLEDRVRDTEAIMIEPKTNDLYLVSKREDSVRLYQVKYPFTRDTLTAIWVAILPFHKIVAASISADGNEVLMKDYDRVYYWKASNNLDLEKLLMTKPIELAYERERQGEAICWARDGKGFYTLSEAVRGEMGRLLYYKRN